jgi:hypothetical protein
VPDVPDVPDEPDEPDDPELPPGTVEVSSLLHALTRRPAPRTAAAALPRAT